MARRLLRETTNASRPRMSPIASGKIQKLLCVHGMAVIVSTSRYDLPRDRWAIRLSIVPANCCEAHLNGFVVECPACHHRKRNDPPPLRAGNWRIQSLDRSLSCSVCRKRQDLRCPELSFEKRNATGALA